jgi:LDH2 family malate/lactate/ureidoglycolate dehydrogenase
MQVSKTELTALLKQVFEGLGFHCGEHEKAADMTTWLAMVGLGGLQELSRAMPYLIDSPAPQLQLLSESDNHAEFDGGGGSTLNFADMATGLACVKALDTQMSCVTVHNCHNRKLLCKILADCGNTGMHCLAYWRNGSTAITEHMFSLRAADHSPGQVCYLQNAVREQTLIANEKRQSLFIHCSRNWHTLEAYQTAIIASGAEPVSETDDMEIHYNRALDKGIAMDEDLWRQLQTLSHSVLVESSEQSRQGAGA